MPPGPILEVTNLWKRYGHPLGHLASDFQRRMVGGENPEPIFWALEDISFDLLSGETLGIIGNNGAGKSTLLKILAGVLPATRGTAEVRGRVFPMIELNAGLKSELTGLENIYLLGAIMGFSSRTMKAKLPVIQEFSELGEFLNKPVWQYSSGMKARLGFSVAMSAEADILLIDEAFSVGDVAFRQKCYESIARLQKAGTTVLFASHRIQRTEQLSSKMLWLQKGRVEMFGEPEEVAAQYLKFSTRTAGLDQEELGEDFQHASMGEVVIRKIEFVDQAGNPLEQIQTGQSFGIRLHYFTDKTLESPLVTIGILTSDPVVLARVTNGKQPVRPDWNGAGVYECFFKYNPLMPGMYDIQLLVRRKDQVFTFRANRAAQLTIVTNKAELAKPGRGLIRMPVKWRDENMMTNAESVVESETGD